MGQPREENGWTAEELAAVTGEPVDRLAKFVDDGLLVRSGDGRYDGDLSEPVRLIDVRPAGRAERPYQRDPVCGMRLDPSDVVTVTEWNGRSYSFCSQECSRMFDEAPERYADVEGTGS